MSFGNTFILIAGFVSSYHGVEGARVARKASTHGLSRADGNLSTGSALGHSSGDLLFGRFKLQRMIGSRLKGRGLNYLGSASHEGHDAHVPFPQDSLGSKYKSGKFLGSGSFGETWLVQDLDAKEGDPQYKQDLALKIFYTEMPDGSYSHITREMLKNGDEDLIEAYESTIFECETAQKIDEDRKRLEEEPGRGEQVRLYAHRLMKCYEHASDPAYVLLSYGGEQSLQSYIETWHPSSNETGSIIKQILQGLQMLSWATPPLIHHDLKTDNIVVRTSSGRTEVTLIDFGGMSPYDEEHSWIGSVSTMTIAPPEWTCAFSSCNAFTYCETLHLKRKKEMEEKKKQKKAGNGTWFEKQVAGFHEHIFGDAPDFAVGDMIGMDPLDVDEMIQETGALAACNQAFDMYSLGNILVRLMTSRTALAWSFEYVRFPSVRSQILDRYLDKEVPQKDILSIIGGWFADSDDSDKSDSSGKAGLGSDTNMAMRYLWVEREFVQSNCVASMTQIASITSRCVPKVSGSSGNSGSSVCAVESLDDAGRAFVATFLPKMLARHAEDRPGIQKLLNNAWLSQMPVPGVDSQWTV